MMDEASKRYQLEKGDCLDVMKTLDAQSIDALIADPPYGTTKLEWDKPIDWLGWWQEVRRICKLNAPIILFSAQPFTTDLINSNRDIFRYEIIWNKTMGVGSYDANKRPLRAHENILVFCAKFRGRKNEKISTYNPQFTKGDSYVRKRRNDGTGRRAEHYNSSSNPFMETVSKGKRYPLSWINFSNGNNGSEHPTQKPLELMTWLVQTYSNPGETVLDCFMGSGMTGVACVKSERHFIGIEKSPDFFPIAERLIHQAELQPKLWSELAIRLP